VTDEVLTSSIADETLFIQAPIHIQVGYDGLVIPGKS
jgi:hypothetical protein